LSGRTRTSGGPGGGTPAFLLIPRRDIDYLEEALALAETAGYRVVRVWRVRYSRRVGRGLLEELAYEADAEGVETIIFYGDPSPSALYMLQKATRKRVIDRVTLILEIFEKHAGSREAQLQIEAASIRHKLPLIREYVRRAKMGEDPGFLGPGEYAIDRYRASLERRLVRIRRELERLRRQRVTRLEKRRKSGMLHVSIVGYASAGKTSIFNALTGEAKPVGEEYFTTLHPKHKAVEHRGRRIVLVDTVGFIRRVPPEIIEAFRSTLEEIAYADAILFVVDVSEPDRDVKEKIEAGLDTLISIGVTGIEEKLVVAANKVDTLSPEEREEKLRLVMEALAPYIPKPRVVATSARTGEGLDRLLDEVVRVAEAQAGAVDTIR